MPRSIRSASISLSGSPGINTCSCSCYRRGRPEPLYPVIHMLFKFICRTKSIYSHRSKKMTYSLTTALCSGMDIKAEMAVPTDHNSHRLISQRIYRQLLQAHILYGCRALYHLPKARGLHHFFSSCGLILDSPYLSWIQPAGASMTFTL